MTDPRDRVRLDTEPHDRVTRIGAAMMDAMRAHPEYGDDVQVIVLLHDPDVGAVCIDGYDDQSDVIVDLFVHLRAALNADGKDLGIMPMPGQG